MNNDIYAYSGSYDMEERVYHDEEMEVDEFETGDLVEYMMESTARSEYKPLTVNEPKDVYSMLDIYTISLTSDAREFTYFLNYAFGINRYYRTYDAGNLMLMYYQNPNATYVYDREIWQNQLGITIKDNAIPIVILENLTQIKPDLSNIDSLYVSEAYDISDTFSYLEGDTRYKFLDNGEAAQSIIELRPCYIGKSDSGFMGKHVVYDPVYDYILTSGGCKDYEEVFAEFCREYFHYYVRHMMDDEDLKEEKETGKKVHKRYTKDKFDVYADIAAMVLSNLYGMYPENFNFRVIEPSFKNKTPGVIRAELSIIFELIYEMDNRIQAYLYNKRYTDNIVNTASENAVATNGYAEESGGGEGL